MSKIAPMKFLREVRNLPRDMAHKFAAAWMEVDKERLVRVTVRFDLKNNKHSEHVIMGTPKKSRKKDDLPDGDIIYDDVPPYGDDI